jgi:hypothetical protein
LIWPRPITFRAAPRWDDAGNASSVNNDRPIAILGFDETFLRPFARALVEASTTRAAYRMTILNDLRTASGAALWNM